MKDTMAVALTFLVLGLVFGVGVVVGFAIAHDVYIHNAKLGELYRCIQTGATETQCQTVVFGDR